MKYALKFDKDKELYLHTLGFSDIKFMTKLSPFTIPEISSITINLLPKRSKNIATFLNNCYPKQVQHTTLICLENLTPLESYFPEFIKIAPKITHKMCFAAFKISERQLKRIFSAFKHVKALIFYRSKLSVPTAPDFSSALKLSQIQHLSLNRCDEVTTSDWSKSFNELQNLIQGLASSEDFREKLAKMVIKKSCLGEKCIRTLMDENGFQKVVIET
ncbi:unnamed protein product [Moneuplotes crassus]|uniref:Uncharacterized protein n=1 Tax=Euplotes crassus TaxID=5936 RepID=A0AAD1XLG1_EUPCR|nr:unnamed protein product [Moneuplotes crassus]